MARAATESAKGIFPAPSSHGLPLKAFNDLLADGYEPESAALMLGWVPEFGRTMLARICKRLGAQAR
jgi:hypothetical protein